MAFTGNKFEFRMVGSSDSISGPNLVLNTIMAESLRQFAERLEGAVDFDASLMDLLRQTFRDHQRILFDGNGYDEAWLTEARHRGLLNLRTTPDALPELVTQKSIQLFRRHGIYEREELIARYNIYVGKYVQEVLIEARTMVDMIGKDILPASSAYLSELCRRIEAQKACGLPALYETETADRLSAGMAELTRAGDALAEAIRQVPAQNEEAMRNCRDSVLSRMFLARTAADALEGLVDRSFWPFPTYVDLLFSEG